MYYVKIILITWWLKSKPGNSNITFTLVSTCAQIMPNISTKAPLRDKSFFRSGSRNSGYIEGGFYVYDDNRHLKHQLRISYLGKSGGVVTFRNSAALDSQTNSGALSGFLFGIQTAFLVSYIIKLTKIMRQHMIFKRAMNPFLIWTKYTSNNTIVVILSYY